MNSSRASASFSTPTDPCTCTSSFWLRPTMDTALLKPSRLLLRAWRLHQASTPQCPKPWTRARPFLQWLEAAPLSSPKSSTLWTTQSPPRNVPAATMAKSHPPRLRLPRTWAHTRSATTTRRNRFLRPPTKPTCATTSSSSSRQTSLWSPLPSSKLLETTPKMAPVSHAERPCAPSSDLDTL